MEQTLQPHHRITLSALYRENNLIIKAISKSMTYELQLSQTELLNFNELQRFVENQDFTILSKTNQAITLKIGDTQFSLPSEEKAISNEFQETITTLTNIFETQFQKNTRLQAQNERIRKDIDELNSKFSKIAQKVLQLTQKVLQNEKLKIELKQVKEQLAELKNQLSNLTNGVQSQKQSPKSLKYLSQNLKVQTEKSIFQQIDEKHESFLDNMLDFLRRISEKRQNTTPESQGQKQSSFSPSLKNAFQILSRIPKIQWKDFDHSSIISTLQERSIIKQFFPKKISSMQLLYRASQNYFSTRKFHQKCNNIPNTLIFVKTQYEKIIGGFTPLKWLSPYYENVKKQVDLQGDSFIFSLTDKQKFPLKNKESAIMSKASWGPVFGCDLVINDKGNQYANCYAKAHVCYEALNGMKESSEGTKRLGGGDKNHFKVKEWEVWRVEFEEDEKMNKGRSHQLVHQFREENVPHFI